MCWLLPCCWTGCCWALPGVPGDEGKSVSSGRSGVSTGRRSRVPPVVVPWFHLLEEVAACRWSPRTLAMDWMSEAPPLSGLRRAAEEEGCISAPDRFIVIEAPDIVLGKGWRFKC